MVMRMVWLMLCFASIGRDVEWVLTSRWDDFRVPIGPLDVGRESSCPWLDDGETDLEP